MKDTTDSLERLSASAGSVAPKREMGMMAWLATEGGRKCPACGKYAKAEELGYTGFSTNDMIVSSYGHLRGFGCNRSQNDKAQAPARTKI
jgi:hypothetical protein